MINNMIVSILSKLKSYASFSHSLTIENNKIYWEFDNQDN